MPLRLPTRRKVATGETPFRRRTPPTPQATRLMRVSLAAGVLLVVVLGIVFIPTALRYGQVKPPVVTLVVSGASPFNVTVAFVSAPFALDTYSVWLNVTSGASHVLDCGSRQEPLANNTPRCGGALTFSDVNGDGILSVGDRFVVRAQSGPSLAYKLLVFNTVLDQASTECPCAVGVLRWT